MSARRALLEDWLKAVLDRREISLTPASGDASFRHYWRLALDGQTLIAMDAPPGLEDTGRFVRIAQAWCALGLRTPAIHAADRERGFLLLEDFGQRLYLNALDDTSADRLYGDALGALAIIQACAPTAELPVYDAPFLCRELDLFRQWLVEGLLGLTLSSGEEADLEEGLALLIASALEQPQVCVHRDFHSRNLMITASPSPGILDFQDAVAGPVTLTWSPCCGTAISPGPGPGSRNGPGAISGWRSSPGSCDRNRRPISCAGSTSWGPSATSRPAASSPGC